MQAGSPRVSIAVPVRNGQRYLAEALGSLLAQTFTDFEVIVCDNASTDGTERIARDYAARDGRVRYHRNARDMGPAGNFNLGFELSRGEYFRWHAHDDVVSADHLEACVSALDADPGVVLAYPQTTIIDETGKALAAYDFRLDTDSPRAVIRFAQLVLVNHRRHRAVEIFGLMRSAALRQTPLQGAYARADSVLLVRMALLGRFIEVPRRAFLSRAHASQSMQTLPRNVRTGRSRLSKYLGTGPLPPPEWWNSSLKGKVSFPEWNLLKEYWVSTGLAPLSWLGRVPCRLVVVEWALLNVPKLVRDIVFAVEHLVAGLFDEEEEASAQDARVV